jgi:UDP-glucose 4-epimerase
MSARTIPREGGSEEMARYLVTGGCGFIGSHLVEALARAGHEVRVLDDLSTGKRGNIPAGIELLVGDVVDAELVGVAVAAVDGVFHLAAIASVERSREAWIATHRTNLTGCVTVFDAVRLRPVPIVYASSAAVYGEGADTAMAETMPLVPLTAYGADKLGCELHGRVAALVHGIPTTGLRFFNVYGPRQDPSSPYSGVISIFCDRLRRRLPIDIHGDGGQSRDFIFVEDAVRGLLAAMTASSAAEGRVFNVCTGKATSIGRLAALIGARCGIVPEIRSGAPRIGEI